MFSRNDFGAMNLLSRKLSFKATNLHTNIYDTITYCFKHVFNVQRVTLQTNVLETYNTVK